MEQEKQETGNTGKQDMPYAQMQLHSQNENMSRDIIDKNAIISAMTL